MKTFFYSFYGKISLSFLLILLILGTILGYVTIQSCIDMLDEARQKMNAPIARNIAREFEPFFLRNVGEDSIAQTIEGMMVLNPEIEIFFLDDRGQILRSFVPPGGDVKMTSVNLMPIQKFLENPDDIHCVGDAPCEPGMQMLFSAAPIRYSDSQSGFVYVVLGVKEYHTALSLVKNSYIGRSTMKYLLITLIFTAIAGLALFAMLTRRFQQMTRTVRQFANGDLQQRIPRQSSDEIGQLGGAFNQMADTIQQNMSDIREKDRLRRDLIANISHDLRSPLASIQGYLETILMKAEQLAPEQRQKMLDTIFKNARQLSRLVGELFEFSKLDARQVHPQKEAFSLAELAQDVVLKFKPRAENRQINLQLLVTEEIPMVSGDIGMIERALSNLIDNALNFTPNSGLVTIELACQNGAVTVKVADTGRGIPEEDLPHVFERFYRVEKSRTRQGEPGGAGLGLAITQKILEAHDSAISVKSALDKGTAFIFSLPVAAG